MISLLIPAYNEAANLPRLLDRVVGDKAVDEVVVIASGCTDATEAIARSFAPRVALYTQAKREGKTSAINLFLRVTSADIIVLESADTLPSGAAFRHLLAPFADQSVGMTGARPMPVRADGLLGMMGRIMWEAHHRVALRTPKLGELVAFRRVFAQLPQTSSVDEASIEAEILEAGYRLVYTPQAVAYNKAPSNLRDFWKQRKRIARGHRILAAQGHTVATANIMTALGATWASTPKHPRGLAALAMLMAIEAVARLQANRAKPEETVWATADTTKALRL